MPTWPASLPQQLEITDFQESPPNTLIRSTTDTGPPKVRSRFSAGIRPIQGRQLLTKAQVATLDTFYVTTLTRGALAFDWVHPRTGDAVSFRFVGPPVYTPIGPDAYYGRYQLEILP
jgi:hypothetical protein